MEVKRKLMKILICGLCFSVAAMNAGLLGFSQPIFAFFQGRTLLKI